MIRLPTRDLNQRLQQALDEYQSEVDSLSTYEERVTRAKESFKSKNVRNNAIFREIRLILDDMCSGNRRCCYCEDSFADEVEHILPKDLYPEQSFTWTNYLYACGPCNSPKSGQFAVIDQNNTLVEIGRKRNDPVIPPLQGTPALINPRFEDPLYFIELDILDTFMYVPNDELEANDNIRAAYTILLLSLNKRETLVQSRRTAYGSYRARLYEYRDKKRAGIETDKLDNLINGIKTMGQPTVWNEMKRQHIYVDELKILFEELPEALSW